ncbi:MAG: Lrp/AsnC family transcriptional regulator [Spirochaetales bacterium]
MSLDKLDLMLIEELETDARQSVQTLASKLGMKRTTISYRLNRMTTQGILKIACVASADLLGFQFPLVIGINVSAGKTNAVADRLVRLPVVKVISLTAGRYSLMAWALLRDRSNLAQFIVENLADIPDITAVELFHSYKWIRDSWRYFKPKTEMSARYPMDSPDDLDLSIINSMQRDPRQPVSELAKKVGCGKSVAKTRLEKLLNDGLISFVSIIDSTALGFDIGVVILIKSKPANTSAVANELSIQSTVRHVSLITGQWQIFVMAQFEDTEYLHNFLSNKLISIPGIMEFEVIYLVKTLKFSMSFFG